MLLLGDWCGTESVFAVTGSLCAVSTTTSMTAPATTATPMAPTTASADRKLMSSIRALSASRNHPLLPLTT